ncbi:MAG: hypothetical protein KF864_09970 [Phycisphaeraceae bacterium]|nr:hypothetical protein [Phycisphaeraceae bacterium]
MKTGQISFVSLLLSGLVLSTLLGGCGAAQRSHQVPVTGAETFVQEGPLGIDVHNAFGSVFIEVDEALTSPLVWVWAKADTAEKSKPTWAAASLDRTDGLPVLRVATENPEGSVAQEYVVRIRVPGCAGVRVRNSGGTVRVTGVKGAVDISNELSASGRGGQAMYVQVSEGSTGPIMLNAPLGTIELRLPASQAGVVSAGSESGRVTVDAATASVLLPKVTTNRWEATVNGGTEPITLRAGSGDVKVLFGR